MQSIKEFEKFKLTKTYVVLHDSNPDFNNRIKNAIEKNWTLTPYEFIQFKDFKNYSDSDKNSFILVSDFGNRMSPTRAYSFYTNGKITKLGYIQEFKDNYVFSNGEVKNKTTLGTTASYATTTLNLQIGGTKYFNWFTNWCICCTPFLNKLYN